MISLFVLFFQPVILGPPTVATVVNNVGASLVIHNPHPYFNSPVIAKPLQETCYSNCDGSTTLPILNVKDFTCFQNAFASASSSFSRGQNPNMMDFYHADCNQDRIVNILDFNCFNNKFVAGCDNYVINNRVTVIKSGTDWIITSNCPFHLHFECSRKVIKGSEFWFEIVGIDVDLENTDQWVSSMIPDPRILD